MQIAVVSNQAKMLINCRQGPSLVLREAFDAVPAVDGSILRSLHTVSKMSRLLYCKISRTCPNQKENRPKTFSNPLGLL